MQRKQTKQQTTRSQAREWSTKTRAQKESRTSLIKTRAQKESLTSLIKTRAQKESLMSLINDVTLKINDITAFQFNILSEIVCIHTTGVIKMKLKKANFF